MDFLFWFFLIMLPIGLMVTWFSWSSSQQLREHVRREMGESLSNGDSGGPVPEHIRQVTLPNCALIDDTQKRVLKIVWPYREAVSIPYRDIVATEVVADSETLLSTSGSSMLGRGAAGLVLGGGIGLLIGALTAKKKQASEVKLVKLKIMAKGVPEPVQELHFGSGRRALDLASYWNDRLTVAMTAGAAA